MLSNTLICWATLAMLHAINAEKLQKPVIQPPFPLLGFKLAAALAVPNFTLEQWEWGYVPELCKLDVEKNNFSAYDLTVFNVNYTDCNHAWTFCRHKDSPNSQRDIADRFGRMPVKMRDYIRHVISLPLEPQDKGGHAYTYADSGDSVYFGDIRGEQAQTLLVHETAHSIDRYSGSTNKTNQFFSHTSTWTDAYDADRVVSGDYARSNQAENFAQEVVLALYDRIVPGGLGPTNPSWTQLSHMVHAVEKELGDVLYQGGTCSRDKVEICDKIVCMGPDATKCQDSIDRLKGGDVPINNTAAAQVESEYRAPLPATGKYQGFGTHHEPKCRGGVRLLHEGGVIG